MNHKKLFVTIAAMLAVMLAFAAVPADSEAGGSDATLSLSTADYDIEKNILRFSGTTTITGLFWFTVTDSNGGLELEGQVCGDEIADGHFTSEAYVVLSDGEYRIKVFKGAMGSNLEDSMQFTVSSAKVSVDKTSISVTEGDSETVTVTVEKCDYSDLKVSSSDTSKITVGEIGTDGKLEITGLKIGEGKVILEIEKTGYSTKIEVEVTEKPAPEEPTEKKEFTFFIKMDVDYDKVNNSYYSEDDLRKGFIIKGMGTNAGMALEDACGKNHIPVSFVNRTDAAGNDLRYWIGSMFGLGDVNMGDGNWKYWAQYGSGYNDKTLGYYYDNSITYDVIYKITSESGEDVSPEVPDKPDKPSEKPLIDEKTEVDKKENPDGSTTTTTTTTGKTEDGKNVEIVENVTEKDGASTTNKTETVKDKDGKEVGSRVTESTTDKDGNTETKTTATKTEEDGSKTSSTSESKLDKDGNGTIESKTVTTKADGSTVTNETVTEKSAEGTKETVVDKTVTEDRIQETKVTETKDADGKSTGKQTESKTEETLKDSEGKETGTMKTEVKETVGKDGKSEKTEDVAVESKDGNVKTETTSKTDKDGKVKAESKTTVKAETKDVGADVIDAALKQSEQALSNISTDKTKVTKTVEVEVSSGTSAALSPEAVKKVSDYGAGLKVSGKEGSIDTDSDVLKNLAGDGTKSVELSMEANNKDILKDKQKDIVGDNHFVDLNALVGGKNVHQLGGKAIITFGYQLKGGESSADLKVFYVDDEGNKTLVDATFANGSFTMTVDHFSVYMVENTAAPAPVDPEVPEDKDEGGISPVLIAGIVVVLIVAIVGVVLYIRKN